MTNRDPQYNHPMDGVGIYIPAAIVGPRKRYVVYFCPGCERTHVNRAEWFGDSTTRKFSSPCSDKFLGAGLPPGAPFITGFDVVIEGEIILDGRIMIDDRTLTIKRVDSRKRRHQPPELFDPS